MMMSALMLTMMMTMAWMIIAMSMTLKMIMMINDDDDGDDGIKGLKTAKIKTNGNGEFHVKIFIMMIIARSSNGWCVDRNDSDRQQHLIEQYG